MNRSEIIIPASTSNLGSGFDTCGMALSLYLRIGVEPRAKGFEIIPTGEGAEKIPLDESNLIIRAARYVASKRNRGNLGNGGNGGNGGNNQLPGARLRIDSQIPLSRGLGSSSAAIIAGISVYEILSGDRLSENDFFDYALHFEGHGDNLAPSMLGGLVVAVVKESTDYSGTQRRSLIAVKRSWPETIKIVLCIPEIEMETVKMRAVLPQMVTRHDAIYNLQRAALFQAALAENRFDLLNEALRDCLHQPYRAHLAPGLSDVLHLNDERDKFPGLLGIVISGAGSSLIALALDNCDEIAAAMVKCFSANGINARALQVRVDNYGRRME
jgi:homoserine kinase